MGKGTIKVKKKCCRSQPPCKSCPIVALRNLLRDAKAEEVKKAQKKAKKEAKKKKAK
ncbi:hypothetical protein SAMN02982929_03727 [Saccharopolyspora kobensis]|uniref:Uncharacterized protein n=1 Tax=Saccharopolyspora kobensis TaxID=146035 RepID=A0A1H6CYL9_9PSEU|nr:hypothetical protein [Saccharopolyspora kobensis]SEG78180.1 hypothetical protein SAMN02982929_03727 [Saccharopolyspora kobensis]SFD04782.1 hypothetical protein SAMN05216506_102322 [Saccharopolyspora kobensis]